MEAEESVTTPFTYRIVCPNGMKDKKHSLETKQKMSNDRQGHVCTQETKDKISIATKGRVVSAETKEKLKLAWTRRKCED